MYICKFDKELEFVKNISMLKHVTLEITIAIYNHKNPGV